MKPIQISKDILITLTTEECNVFRNLCEEFLGSYKVKISKSRALILSRILDKLEEREKK